MLENVIKKLSAVVATIIVWSLCCGFYLSMKGFEYDENGGFILKNVKAAEAENEVVDNIVPLNFAFPQDHVFGDKNAPVTIYEYSSFGCFHCAEFHVDVLPALKKEYVDSGKVKLVFVPLPTDKISMEAALLAECVKNDKYFEFVDLLFKKQRDWTLAFNPTKKLKQYAGLSGVAQDDVCLKNDEKATRILKDRQDALLMLKIKGTPAFVIASKKKNTLVMGYKTFEELSSIIDAQLAEIEKK